jgi:hypothetical protein
MTWLRLLEAAGHLLGLILVALLLAAWLLEDIAVKATRMVDGFLIPVIQRLGDLGAAWQRLLVAMRAARAQWRG